MIINLQVEKEHPMVDVTAEIVPGQPTETDSSFIFPLIMPMLDGTQTVVATIECVRLGVEEGKQRFEVKAAQYVNGELGESSLLNHILIDLKQFVPPTDENEVVLAVTAKPVPKPKASQTS